MGFPSLNPLFGLGSYGRVIGATLVSTPRSTFGSANRIYNFMKKTKGVDFTLNYFNNLSFGPYKFNNRKTGLILK